MKGAAPDVEAWSRAFLRACMIAVTLSSGSCHTHGSSGGTECVQLPVLYGNFV